MTLRHLLTELKELETENGSSILDRQVIVYDEILDESTSVDAVQIGNCCGDDYVVIHATF